MTDVQVIQFAKQVHTALTGNPNVPAPNPPLSTLQSLIATAESSIDAYEAEKAILRNKKNLRDEAMKALCHGLRLEADTVQAATSGDPDKMDTAGFRAGKRPSPVGIPAQVTGLVLEAGPIEGTLKAGWKPVRGVKVYEIESSPDPIGANTWSLQGHGDESQGHHQQFRQRDKDLVARARHRRCRPRTVERSRREDGPMIWRSTDTENTYNSISVHNGQPGETSRAPGFSVFYGLSRGAGVLINCAFAPGAAPAAAPFPSPARN